DADPADADYAVVSEVRWVHRAHVGGILQACPLLEAAVATDLHQVVDVRYHRQVHRAYQRVNDLVGHRLADQTADHFDSEPFHYRIANRLRGQLDDECVSLGIHECRIAAGDGVVERSWPDVDGLVRDAHPEYAADVICAPLQTRAAGRRIAAQRHCYNLVRGHVYRHGLGHGRDLPDEPHVGCSQQVLAGLSRLVEDGALEVVDMHGGQCLLEGRFVLVNGDELRHAQPELDALH